MKTIIEYLTGKIKYVNIFFYFIGSVYFFCMVLWPVLHFDWDYTLRVWDRWQSLNVGMIALLSSYIALNISIAKSKEERRSKEDERKRNFIASRAYLPHLFSELTNYCENCFTLMLDVYECICRDVRIGKDKELSVHGYNLSIITDNVNDLPASYRDILSRCITYADPEIASYFANIISKLQIQHARLSDMVAYYQNKNEIIVMDENIKQGFFDIAEVNALINKQFNFARGMDDFNNSKLEYKDFENVYKISKIDLELMEVSVVRLDLESFTKERLRKM